MITKRKSASRPAAKQPRRAKRSYAKEMAAAADSRKPPKQRIAALADAPLAVTDSHKNLRAVLKVLCDTSEPVDVRLAALQAVQSASFSVVAFEGCRSEYIAALRSVIEDKDPELRQRVLGILAREKDGFAQKKLMEGLRRPERALVPPEKALQLLSYDLHTDAYRIAREIAIKPPNDVAKREALRLLAADAGSAPMFERILRDKGEAADTRQIAAAALRALTPDKLQELARQILLDPTEQGDLQATCLTALTQFGDGKAIADDAALRTRVEELSDAATVQVKRSARQFLQKYSR